MASTYVETGTRIRVYDSSVKTHASLPLGTYRVHFDGKEGFSLLRVENLTAGGERVYGQREQKVEKIFRSYERTDRSLGVLLSGDKGQGKSLFLRMVGQEAIARGIPVVLVTQDVDGIADFLDSLEECLIIFDEFEKIFPNGRQLHHGEVNRQHQFLSLFDGMSQVKRIYCVTVNDVHDVSQYIVNRPGRFHYHMRFDYPGPDEVRQYLTDQAPEAPASEVQSAALFSRRVRLNYDHLRAIAFELNNPTAQFSEIVHDLNIKAIEPSHYRVEAKFADGSCLAGETALNLFERVHDTRTLELRNEQRSLYISFLPRDLVFEEDGSIQLPLHKTDILDEYDETPDDLPVSVSLTLVGHNTYAFDAF